MSGLLSQDRLRFVLLIPERRIRRDLFDFEQPLFQLLDVKDALEEQSVAPRGTLEVDGSFESQSPCGGKELAQKEACAV